MDREISERDATLAVDAAAKAAFDRYKRGTKDVDIQWEGLDPGIKLHFREVVLPTVWAALGALPDHRHTAWLEGYIAADNGRDIETNPYPAQEA